MAAKQDFASIRGTAALLWEHNEALHSAGPLFVLPYKILLGSYRQSHHHGIISAVMGTVADITRPWLVVGRHSGQLGEPSGSTGTAAASL